MEFLDQLKKTAGKTGVQLSYSWMEDPLVFTTPAENFTARGVANFVSEISYKLKGEQGETALGAIKLDHHWQLIGLELSPGDNHLTVTGKGIDGEEQQDVLTITSNPGLTMGPVAVAPDLLNHESPEPVLVTVALKDEPTLGANGVQLYAADEQGTVSGPALASLKDDGTGGDATAGDGTFSGQVTLDVSQEQVHHLRLQISHIPSGGSVQVARSELFKVRVLPPFTAADAQAMETIMALVQSSYKTHLQTGDQAAAFAQVAVELEALPEVDETAVDEEGYSVMWRMTCGASFVYSDLPEGTKGDGDDLESAGLITARLLEPYANEFGSNAQAAPTEQILEGFRCPSVHSTDVVLEKEVTLEEVKQLKDNNFILISSHGWVSPKGAIRGQVYFTIKEEVSKAKFFDPSTWQSRDLRAGRISAWWRVVDPDRWYYRVPATFNEHYVKPLPPGTIVHVDSCGSAKNQTMARAFLKNGAMAYTGWTHTVGFKYSHDMMGTYYREIRRGRSVPDAVMAARKEHGYTDPTNSRTRLVAVLSGSTHKPAVLCDGWTRLTQTLSEGRGHTVFYSVDRLEPHPHIAGVYYMKEAKKHCSFARQSSNTHSFGEGTLQEVYAGFMDLDLERRSTVDKIELDRESNTLRIVSIPNAAVHETEDTWVTAHYKTYNRSWTDQISCPFPDSIMPHGVTLIEFTGDEVEIGPDFVKGKVDYQTDKGTGTWEFYYDLKRGE